MPRVSKIGRWLAPGLVSALVVVWPSGTGLGSLSVSAQQAGQRQRATPIVADPGPRGGLLMSDPFNDFVPFDEPDADFYSFEVSDLDVYNFSIFTNEATTRLRGGQNDVLEIVGEGDGAFAVGFPDRIGFDRVAVFGTVGVPTKGGKPVLTGITPGTTFAGFGIDAIGEEIDSAFVGAKPMDNGTETLRHRQDLLGRDLDQPPYIPVGHTVGGRTDRACCCEGLRPAGTRCDRQRRRGHGRPTPA